MPSKTQPAPVTVMVGMSNKTLGLLSTQAPLPMAVVVPPPPVVVDHPEIYKKYRFVYKKVIKAF